MHPELFDLAQQSTVWSHAERLAAWVGAGKPVTGKDVLRPVDARSAARELGIMLPRHVRSATDVRAIHHPWLVAQAAGMLVIDASQATAAPTPDGDPLTRWLSGLDAVLRAESHDRPRRQGAVVLCRALLTLLATDQPPAVDELPDTAYQLLEFLTPQEAHAAFEAFSSGMMPVDAAMIVLADFGALDDQTRITPLGRWAHEQLQARVPAPITPDLSPGEVLARLATLPEDETWQAAGPWLEGRAVTEAAAQLLQAADTATAPERVAAVNLVADLGDEALPAWHKARRLPNLAAHAQWMLTDPADAAGLDETQRCWLITEHSLATLAARDAENAYHFLHERGGMDAIDRSAHPEADLLRDALTRFAVSDAGRPRIHQLKIELVRMRPAVWRRVLVPAGASLGALHAVIQIVLGWGDDHLHQFTVDGAHYADPFYGLEECGDEARARLSKTLPRPGSIMTYVYDFGDWWEHRITLEKILDPEDGLTYPTCTAGRGDAPVEDWNPEFPTDPTTFDRADINHRLTNLSTRVPAH